MKIRLAGLAPIRAANGHDKANSSFLEIFCEHAEKYVTVDSSSLSGNRNTRPILREMEFSVMVVSDFINGYVSHKYC
jgi:hypothetical protein